MLCRRRARRCQVPRRPDAQRPTLGRMDGWPVVAYAAVIAIVGVIATMVASIRPDVKGAGRLHELNVAREV